AVISGPEPAAGLGRTVKITGFGIAQAIGSEPRHGHRGRDGDRRVPGAGADRRARAGPASDLYALGVAYECLAGAPTLIGSACAWLARSRARRGPRPLRGAPRVAA